VPAYKPNRPQFWIVAGPNGSGKSTLYTKASFADFTRSIWIINPDLLTARIRDVESLRLRVANLEAVKRIYVWFRTSIAAHQTVGVETVLSTSKYRRLVRAAKSRQFEIRLIYVVLKSADLNVERVALRVAQGGHDVPKQKIIQRRARSLRQLPWFLAQADRAWIYDNSTAEPRLIVTKTGKQIDVDGAALPEIKEAARLAGLQRTK
jgi:predicted ABC-type ATPase